MADIVNLTNLTIDPSQYYDYKEILLKPNPSLHFKVVANKKGETFLSTDYEISYDEDQKIFFRNISFLLRCSHPLIAKLKGFSFFSTQENIPSFTVISEYAENGFLCEFIPKVKSGVIKGFDATAKSKYVFAIAFIGQFLNSRKIVHRCFAPPSFGIKKNFEPLLMVFTSAKSSNAGVNINKTINISDSNWNPPETDDDGILIDLDSTDAQKLDIFSFGTLIYYLYTYEPPFGTGSIVAINKRKKEPLSHIPPGMPDELKELLEECWSPPNKRPSFPEVLMKMQSHKHLFPGTNLAEFDKCVKQILSYEVKSSVCNATSSNKEISKSIDVLTNAIKGSFKTKYTPSILKSIDTIREQFQPYVPILIEIIRPGYSNKVWLQVPSFMFVASLHSEIYKLCNLPERFQKVEINNNFLIRDPSSTIDELRVKPGATFRVYNSFGDESLGSDILRLNIKHFGNVSLAYVDIDSVETLKNDISFLTRIPIGTLKLTFEGRELDNENESLADLGIEKNSLIEVDTTFENETFRIIVQYIDGREDVVNVKSLMKISELMKSLKLNSSKCYATFNREKLCLHKAFIDYFIVEKSVITIHYTG